MRKTIISAILIAHWKLNSKRLSFLGLHSGVRWSSQECQKLNRLYTHTKNTAWLRYDFTQSFNLVWRFLLDSQCQVYQMDALLQNEAAQENFPHSQYSLFGMTNENRISNTRTVPQLQYMYWRSQ